MADRQCVHCDDRGDCTRCSWFFQPDKVHGACGFRWRDHEIRSQDFYAPYSVCPPKPLAPNEQLWDRGGIVTPRTMPQQP